MFDNYRVALNIEWTSKCNAQCTMCPRGNMPKGMNMSAETWDLVLSRIKPEDVSRCVIAGYGEPTTHPQFESFLDRIKGHPVRFDMATNADLLSRDRLERIDGTLGLLLISFSSIVPDVYRRVHKLLDYDRVLENILLAKKILKNTAFGISLSPDPTALETLDQTIDWFRREGINVLTMSPTLYNRAGSDPSLDIPSERLRKLIKKHGLHSQELDFVSGPRDFLGQWFSNRFRCIPRNADLLIAASGSYLYCFNDIGHEEMIGNVDELGVRAAIRKREGMGECKNLCSNCNLKGRYRNHEILQVALKYGTNRFAAAINQAG